MAVLSGAEWPPMPGQYFLLGQAAAAATMTRDGNVSGALVSGGRLPS